MALPTMRGNTIKQQADSEALWFAQAALARARKRLAGSTGPLGLTIIAQTIDNSFNFGKTDEEAGRDVLFRLFQSGRIK